MDRPELTGPRRILLVTMPLADPILPNLAIEQLAAVGRDYGEPCDVLYGTLLLPKSVPPTMIHGMAGPAIFTPSYFDISPEDVAAKIAERIVSDGDCSGPERDELHAAITMEYLWGMEEAESCLRRCMAAISENLYDVIGFSVGFDAQKLPSAALARQLKVREPQIRILFGGTGCDGDMGPALIELFPEVDAVLQNEAEHSFLPTISALRGERSFDGIPACIYRRGKEVIETEVDGPLPVLDDIPSPDYQSYLDQRSESPYGTLEKIVLFETSRGCWWGRKHHCNFCGIRAVDLPYRTRSNDGTLNHIKRLQDLYDPDLLYSTDSILSIDHITRLFPQIAQLRRRARKKLSFFYEIKSNLRREQIALLAAAGVKRIQPGIESFSTNSLRNMKKGATGLQQIETLKWAQAYGITVVYGILIGTPGESVDDLEQMASLIPALHHLPPPGGVNRLALHKFSPYSVDPEKFGFENVRPFPMQRIIYPASAELLTRLCYELEYDLREQQTPQMIAARKRLARAVQDWRHSFFSGTRMFVSEKEGVLVVTRISGDGVQIRSLAKELADVYRCCKSVNSLQSIARQIGMDLKSIEQYADDLRSEGLIASMDGKCLALAVPSDADEWGDARLEGAVPASPLRPPELVEAFSRPSA